MQTIKNLVQNSVEAFPTGAGDDEPHRVRVATRRDRDGVRVVVSDNGCGIEGLERASNEDCFAHFQFGKAGGTGVGMQYVLSTAQEDGWDIAIESAVSGGTTVTLTVPAAVNLLETTATPTPAGEADTGASIDPIRETGSGSR